MDKFFFKRFNALGVTAALFDFIEYLNITGEFRVMFFKSILCTRSVEEDNVCFLQNFLLVDNGKMLSG